MHLFLFLLNIFPNCTILYVCPLLSKLLFLLSFSAATNNLPTQTHGHKDPATVAAVVDPDENTKVINVAKAIVSVSSLLEIEGNNCQSSPDHPALVFFSKSFADDSNSDCG